MTARWIDTGTVIVPDPYYDREKMGEPVREWEGVLGTALHIKEAPLWRGIYCFRSRGFFAGQTICWGRRITCATPYTKEWREEWSFMGDGARDNSFKGYDFDKELAAAQNAPWGYAQGTDSPSPCFVHGWDEKKGAKDEGY